jgi:hypothetical protein
MSKEESFAHLRKVAIRISQVEQHNSWCFVSFYSFSLLLLTTELDQKPELKEGTWMKIDLNWK